MNAILKSGWDRLRTGALPTLPPALIQSLGPLMLMAAGLTAVVLMFLWNAQAEYKPVFGAREKVAAADMMTVLEAERIPTACTPTAARY